MANQQSLKSRAVRGYGNFFPLQRRSKVTAQNLKEPWLLQTDAFEKYTSTEAEQELEDTSKKKYWEPGAGRKPTAPKVRQATFQWFIDVYWCLY